MAVGSTLLLPGNISALSGNDFKAGRIIDDNVMYDGNAMDIPTIQAFLESKVPNCDTNGVKPSNRSGYTTRASYGAAQGNPAPYTCLRDYTMDVYGKDKDAYCDSIPYGRYSAAGIIYTVGKACKISQKALIILLQKEQSLVTDDWPWQTQYQKATGFGCPDTAACDSQYGGLFNQVYYGARQYQIYASKPQNYNFQRNTTRNIRYNPNAACGDSSIYVENRATAGLYNYTPYQPNGPALNNLYGTGDNCSAYGNRNFWRMYNDWFGNTYGIPFSASFVAVGDAASVDAGHKDTLWFKFQNTGSQFWKDDASALPYYPRTRLAASWPINRVSNFYDPSSWLSSSRPTGTFAKVYESDGTTLAPDQHTVWPGQVARLEFSVQLPNGGLPAGSYKENFELVQDGIPNFWVTGGYAWQAVNVAEPFAARFYGQSDEPTVSAAQPNSPLWFKFQNTGSQFWKDDASALPYYPRTRLVGSWPINRGSDFYDPSSWLTSSRPVSQFTQVYEKDGTTLASDQHTVWPGQVAKFQMNVKYKPGMSVGAHKEDFELVQDGISNFWVYGGYAWRNVNVNN
jgi:hypothetical protein